MRVPTVGDRWLDTSSGWEYDCIPELAGEPVGSRVVFRGGRIGRHDGGGWILVYGDGYRYDFARSA